MKEYKVERRMEGIDKEKGGKKGEGRKTEGGRKKRGSLKNCSTKQTLPCQVLVDEARLSPTPQHPSFLDTQ